jgi:Rod binding domain-containing protein
MDVKANPIHRTRLQQTPVRTTVSAKDLNGVASKHSELSDHDRLEKQARKLVSQTFFGTLMKQMRQSPFKSDLFDGGRGGQAFGELYDQQLTERMSRGAGAHLVNSIVRRLEGRANAVRQQVAAGRKAA